MVQVGIPIKLSPSLSLGLQSNLLYFSVLQSKTTLIDLGSRPVHMGTFDLYIYIVFICSYTSGVIRGHCYRSGYHSKPHAATTRNIQTQSGSCFFTCFKAFFEHFHKIRTSQRRTLPGIGPTRGSERSPWSCCAR